MKRTGFPVIQRAAALASFVLLEASVLAAPTSTEVFNRHFESIGGRDAVARLQSVVARGTLQEAEHEFTFSLQLKPPGLILLTASNNMGALFRHGRDAQGRCWKQGPQGVHEITGRDAGELMDLCLGLHLPGQVGLFEKLTQAVCEDDRDGDREVIAIGRKDSSSPFPRLLFDQTTGLLVRAGESRFEDYRAVDGFKVPFVLRPDARTVLRVKSVSFNEAVDDSVFEQPKGATPMPKDGPMGPERCQTLLSPPGKIEIVRRPPPANFGRGALPSLPSFDPKSSRHAQVDLRGYELTGLDLSDRLTDLLHADFDSVTRWPATLPPGFDRDRIMELGKDPGLGIRKLHTQGITGKGIGIGIIDQPLLVDHEEYRDRLRLYEEIHNPANSPAQMHGPAVASIAVGRTVGVAPDAELYYIAEQHGVFTGPGKFDWDFTWLAQSIERLLEVNAGLPADRKIRVISISVGWSPGQKGYAEAMAAVEHARTQNVFIVSTAIEQTHKLAFHGLGREAMSDPNDATSFGPGSWWANIFWGGQHRFGPRERLQVPMDSRCLASPTGPQDYVHYYSAGWSWSVPWIAGLYALACQVRSDLTPEVFWAEAIRTGKTIRARHEGQEVEFGAIAEPAVLLESLRRAGGN